MAFKYAVLQIHELENSFFDVMNRFLNIKIWILVIFEAALVCQMRPPYVPLPDSKLSNFKEILNFLAIFSHQKSNFQVLENKMFVMTKTSVSSEKKCTFMKHYDGEPNSSWITKKTLRLMLVEKSGPSHNGLKSFLKDILIWLNSK